MGLESSIWETKLGIKVVLYPAPNHHHFKHLKKWNLKSSFNLKLPQVKASKSVETKHQITRQRNSNTVERQIKEAKTQNPINPFHIITFQNRRPIKQLGKTQMLITRVQQTNHQRFYFECLKSLINNEWGTLYRVLYVIWSRSFSLSTRLCLSTKFQGPSCGLDSLFNDFGISLWL